MLIIYLHTKLHVPRSICLLLIFVELQAKENIHTACTLFHI
jgi:hypothetical protein